MESIEAALHAPFPPSRQNADPLGETLVERDQFVTWLRAVAPYIHAFRGKTFVVGVGGEMIAAGMLEALVQDLSLLNAMGMRIVVVHGSRPQVVEQLRLRGVEDHYVRGLRVTDAIALECAKEAAGEIRLDIEAAFSQGLPNTPMAHSTVRVISGNFVTARPVGIVNGVDHLHTGVARKIDAQSIRFALQSGAIVLVSPLGFSPTGEAFNLGMEDVAAATAIAIDADKLVFVTEVPGVLGADDQVLGEVSEADATRILAAGELDCDTECYLRQALRACEGGVARAHIIPFQINGSVLLELFRHDGVGTMVVEETLEALREATIDDLGGILAIIRPLEEDGTLVPREHAQLEREIESFSVIEHDGVIFGCASLRVFAPEQTGEMYCLAVSGGAQTQGDGERLLRHIEQRARAAGLTRLYVLTTRTMHWFLKRGFRQGTPDDLPASRRDSYDWRRRSQVLIKVL